MFHNEDIVEEVATGRQGKVTQIHFDGAVQNRWHVVFEDGKQPPINWFKEESELRLVKCPHSGGGEPGFYPERPLAGSLY